MRPDHKEACVLRWEVRALIRYRELLTNIKQGSGIRSVIQKGFSGSSVGNGTEVVLRVDGNPPPSRPR